MPHRTGHDEEWDDEPDWDTREDDDEPTIPCPNCREKVHEDAPQCPYCGHYISEEEARSSAKPWWVIVAAVLALLAALSWIM